MADIRFPPSTRMKDTDRACALEKALRERLKAESDGELLCHAAFSIRARSQFSSGQPVYLSLGSALSNIRRRGVREPKTGFDLDQLVLLVRARMTRESEEDAAIFAQHMKAKSNLERLQALVPEGLRSVVHVQAGSTGECAFSVSAHLPQAELVLKAIVAALTNAGGDAG